jgi:hypothetical protein
MEENAYATLVRKPEGKRRLASRRPRWEDNTKTDHKKLNGRAWTYMTQERNNGQDLMKTQLRN